MNTNISPINPEDQIANILKTLGQNIRILIILIIGEREACVCHLEAILGIRQARISQHLMALRKVGIVTTQRFGRHIYYQLENKNIVDLVYQAAQVLQIDKEHLRNLSSKTVAECTCPRCKPDLEPKDLCQ